MSEQPATQSSRVADPVTKGRPFRLLLIGSSASVLGTRMSTIAFPMLVLWLTGSPVAAGWTAFAATAPSILVYMPAGALVDRWHPGRVMLVSEFGRGVAIATVAGSLLFGRPHISLLIGAAVIEEILEVFSTLAERRYVSSLAGHEQASSALVRMEARTHVMVLAGRPLGGSLFAVMPTLPFIADTASFVISVSALLRIRSGQVAELATHFYTRISVLPFLKGARAKKRSQAIASSHHPVSREELWDDIREGVRWLHHDRFTRVTVALSAGTTLICQALIMVFLAYAHAQKLSSVTIGISLAASGLGGALGSMIASRLPAPTRWPWTLIRICVWITSVAVLKIPERPSFPCMAFAMGALGFTGALGNVELGTYLIQNAPKEMLARVTSIGRLMSFGACAVGPVLGGVVIQEYKIWDAVLLLAVAIIVLSAFSLLLPSSRTGKSRLQKILYLASGIGAVQELCRFLTPLVLLRSWEALGTARRHSRPEEVISRLPEKNHSVLAIPFSAEPVPDSSALVSQVSPVLNVWYEKETMR
jgi:MFS family permease